MAGPRMPKPWFQAETERNRLLPLLCPSCLAVGVRPVPIPIVQGDVEPKAEAYYCERCADLLERAKTVRVARSASSALIGVGVATSAALALGGSRLGLQIALTLLGSLLPLGIAWPAADGEAALYRDSSAPRVERWFARRRDYLQALGASTVPVPRPKQRGRLVREFLPGLAALAWLAGLHWLGRAELRVIHAGDGNAIVLVDERRQESIGPTRTEHPYAARSVSTLAGRRSLGLVSDEGETVARVTATLLPGRDYVFGALPAGSCLFVERQEYGQRGDAHELIPVEGSGPLWELPVNVDVWFSPLRERPALPTSGGVRSAVRLRSCAIGAEKAPW